MLLSRLPLPMAARSVAALPVGTAAVLVEELSGDVNEGSAAIITSPRVEAQERGLHAASEVPVAVYVATAAQERLTIGRRSFNDIVISDIRVSGEHATLERADGGFLLTDKGSSNGTTVKGRLLPRGEAVLVPFGGSFAIAEVRVVVLDATQLALLARGSYRAEGSLEPPQLHCDSFSTSASASGAAESPP